MRIGQPCVWKSISACSSVEFSAGWNSESNIPMNHASNPSDHVVPPEVCAVETVSLHVADVQQSILKVLTRQGLFGADSQHVIDYVLSPWLPAWGGLHLPYLSSMVRAMDLGEIDPRGRILTVRDQPSLVHLDGSRAAGPVAMAYATELLVEKAKATGIAGAIIRNSSAIDRPEAVVANLAHRGLISFMVSSTGRAEFSPVGDRTPRVAGHRSAWCLPAASSLTLISTQVASLDSLMLLDPAQTEGQPAADLAFDKEGQPARSWNSARTFGLLTGEHDLQYGLLCGLLLAALSDGRLPTERAKKSPFGDDSEHLLLAIEPSSEMAERFPPERLAAFVSSMKHPRAIQHLEKSPALPDTIEVPLAHQQMWIELLDEQRIEHPWR